MAEKRVSVRLVAEGGRQVRAELEGIGDAGARGFGRLSTEMELANTRLASFARKAGLALAAVTVAAAAAGVAMVRSGLETIGAQADMAASLKTTVESLQVLTWAAELAGVSMGEIEQATKKLTTRLSEAAAGSGSAVGALQRLNLSAAQLQALPLDQRIVAIQEALNRFVPEAERAAVASDLFGDKAALAFLRIDPATLREAAQDMRDFGVAVSAADAAQIERTGDAIAKLSLIWLGLTNRLTAAVAPALETIANTLADIARSTGPIGIAINALFDNIGRLTTYAATFATLMAGRWVAGLAAAALSVRGLATGLVILRGALIRTGIGALIVGAGELVFQFTRLVAGAGGFGAAIGLLKDLALEVWDRIGFGAASAWSKIEASWAGLQATIYGAMQSSVEAVTSFGNSAAGIFKGAYDAVKAIWGQLPGAIGDFAFQAANGLIGGVEAMLNGVVTRINNFINGLNAALDLLPDWAVGEGGVRIGSLDPVALGRIDNPFAGSAAAAGTAAAEAFSAAMAQTYVTTPDLGLTGMAEEATARADAYREASGMLADAAARPMQSWKALKDAVAGAGTEGEAALDGAADAADRLDESMTEAGRAAGGAGAAVAAGAEVAKTGWEAAGNNWIGFCMHRAPGPFLAVQPTVDLAKRLSQQRIDPLIEESPDLRALVLPSRSRDAGNTILGKRFPGGQLILTGANSAVGLRSMPARWVFLDEVDAYPGDVDGEGDPIALAEARTISFGHRSKVFLASTPTLKGLSRIEREWELSDQQRYHVPCPHCGGLQWLQFERLRWEPGKAETVQYLCQHCDAPIAERHKTWMMAEENGAGWQATAPPEVQAAAKAAGVVGYHISGLYSPLGWLSWEEIARGWEGALGNDAALKTLKNTILGETWQERGEAPDWQRLYERRADWQLGVAPDGVLLLTAGADVQRDRIEVDVWGWGRNLCSWLVDHVVLEGDTARPEVWAQLSAFLGQTWEHASGCRMALARMAIDSGDGVTTDAVYSWVRAAGRGQVIAIKGVAGFDRSTPVDGPTYVEVTEAGRKLRRGVQLWKVAGAVFKSETYRFLRLVAPTDEELAEGGEWPHGFVHIPKGTTAEWMKQLTAEQLMTIKTRQGFQRLEWQQTRERNEALDCRVYARAAAWLMGIDRWDNLRWEQLEAQLDRPTGPTEAPPAGQPNRPAPPTTAKRPAPWMGARKKWF